VLSKKDIEGIESLPVLLDNLIANVRRSEAFRIFYETSKNKSPRGFLPCMEYEKTVETIKEEINKRFNK